MKQTLQKYALSLSVAATTLATSASVALAEGNVDIGETKLAQGFALDLGTIITGLLQFIMAIAALLVFLYLIWGGIQWITSGGDKSKTEEARNKITAAVLGLIVLAAAYAILQIMLKFLGLDSISGAFNKIEVIKGGGSTPL